MFSNFQKGGFMVWMGENGPKFMSGCVCVWRKEAGMDTEYGKWKWKWGLYVEVGKGKEGKGRGHG